MPGVAKERVHAEKLASLTWLPPAFAEVAALGSLFSSRVDAERFVRARMAALGVQMGRHDEAAVDILKALDADFRPETGDEAILASRTLLAAQQIKRAITTLEAITLNRASPSAEAWSLLGRAHLADDATALALSALTQSLSIQPAQADTLALRGALLRRLGDLEGAAADTESALILDPGNPALTYTLGLIRFQQGDLAAAEQRIGLSATRLPENPGI